jgi:hypothetical protein
LTFVIAWAAFPLVLCAVGLGWGALVEELSGARLQSGALVVPLGLAAVIVVAGILTTNAVTARLAVPVVGVVAVVGLVRSRGLVARWPKPGWPALAALGVLLAYGAPVLATGTATWTGYIKLDDTSTWLAITAQMFSHGRSTAGLPPSVYQLVLSANLGSGAYPIGGFMLLGIGRALVHTDAAWVFQPYIACAGAALALCLYGLSEPFVGSRRFRSLAAFLAAQPALLYGYSLWGGIKEMTAAFLVALVVALAAQDLRRRPLRPRAVLPLAVATAALIVTFGPGTAVWVVPAFSVVAIAWLWTLIRRKGSRRAVVVAVGSLAAGTVALSLPVWLVLAQSLTADSGFVSGPSAQMQSVRLGNLHAPLSVFQLAGIWPLGDFRNMLGTTGETILLIGVVIVAGLAALFASIRFRRQAGIALYLVVALGGCLAIDLAGGVPWVVGKSLAIASPALLFAGVIGGVMLFGRRRVPGVIVLGIIGGGVLWSNALQYSNVSFAPAARMAELEHIGTLVSGRGPTFINDYEVFADRYFLRDGQPVEPAEYRPVPLAPRNGVLLDKPAWADLDSFKLQTLLPFRSIVTPRSPAESRPPSIYHLVWEGPYYELWQRPVRPSVQILEHVPFGDANQDPYCGQALSPRTGRHLPLAPFCPVEPVAPAACSQVHTIAHYAAIHGAELVADERQPSTYVLADQTQFPRSWLVSPTSHVLAAFTPGSDLIGLPIKTAGRYMLWLGGNFGRGFDVSLDGQSLGRVHNALAPINGYVPVVARRLDVGVHTIEVTYPGAADLAPGDADELGTMLASVVLEPLAAESGRLVTVSPDDAATRLCGQSVDWIEVVAPQT